MNFHSYGESPSKSVRIITGQSVLIDPSSRPKGTCLEVESGIARVYCPCEETEGMTLAFLQSGDQLRTDLLCSEGVCVEALTDNKNRTASKLRTIFQKNGGNLGTQGSAAHNFKQIGVIRIDINEIKDDKIFELAIDAGADECFSLENFHEIHCGFDDIYSIKKKN